MKENTMASGRLSLRSMVFGGGAVLMLMPAIIAGTFYTGALQRRAETLLVERLKARGELSASLLGRRLNQLWQEVSALSKIIDVDAPAKSRDSLNLISQLDTRYSWIGVADVAGTVLIASRGMLEGQSVAERPWFRRGLRGPTAVDVHQAQMLAKLMPAAAEPYHFIDMAAPIQKSNAVIGVVGAHLDWRWVVDSLNNLQAPGIELLLLSRERTVLYGPASLIDKPLNIGAAQAANRVTLAVLDERWSDGKDYVTVVVPSISYGDLPGFGWSLLVRQNLDEALATTRELVRTFWLMLGAGAIVALALLYLGSHWITTPLRRLASSSEAIVADGEQTIPYLETRYAEAARLSHALVRLQSKISRR
ncbi:hypothetical protein BHK69_15110 [Bosea vaviloviae]|uniref:HAMP domain-containing protein n=2 Tax=Bosea vaviloviae TaxID=1526658 RepID=A0A1D7U2K4_9HYPH|nr:hypothetical protein BHK69_15110 [Bosea vaviloviae]